MITLSSQQDFATKLAHVDATILRSYSVMGLRPTIVSQAHWAASLHQAMGHRADQPEY